MGSTGVVSYNPYKWPNISMGFPDVDPLETRQVSGGQRVFVTLDEVSMWKILDFLGRWNEL